MTYTINNKQNKIFMLLMTFVMMFTMFAYSPVNDVFAGDVCPEGKFMDIADGKWKVQEGTGEPRDMTDGEKTACEKLTNQFGGKMMGFITILSSLAFVFAFGMVVYGGVKYIGSQGDERQTEEAKKQMWYAGVGCLIIASAFVIFKMIMGAIQ